MFYDWTIILLIPAVLLALYAQSKMRREYNEYARVASSKGMTAADVAQSILLSAGIKDVSVKKLAGRSMDHYDPRDKSLGLSVDVYDSTSITAIGVAAHEAGHALQHNEGYAPLSIRNAIFPVVSFSSSMAMPLILIGFLISLFSGIFGSALINVGIVLFAAVVAFHFVTLPVEFNASKKAVQILGENYYLTNDELVGAKKVLNAAALTYVAAAASALAQLMRLLLISNRRR